MKRITFIFTFTTILIISGVLMAADKVVVVPLNSARVAGTDGQVQYNDAGKTAGAKVYYDKATGKLEVVGEVRTVDESGNNRLWGKGRPGTSLLSHTDPNGYCTSTSGVKFAISKHLAPWAGVADLCPVGSWVCSENDLAPLASCPVQPFTGYYQIGADGTPTPANKTLISDTNNVGGWLADAGTNEESGRVTGSTDTWSSNFLCNVFFRTWCCWN